MTRWATVLAFVFSVTAPVSGFSQDLPPTTGKPCRQHPQLTGPCFTVHGALRYYNGAPAVRIWKIGTDHLLGVSAGRFAVAGYCNLPTEFVDTLNAGKEVVADFVVCPFTPERAGEMQLVCVDSASNIKTKPYRF